MFIRFHNHTIINVQSIVKVEKRYKSGRVGWIRYMTITLADGSETDIIYDNEEQRDVEFDKIAGLLEAK